MSCDLNVYKDNKNELQYTLHIPDQQKSQYNLYLIDIVYIHIHTEPIDISSTDGWENHLGIYNYI